MQTAPLRIRIRVDASIFYVDNHYNTSTYSNNYTYIHMCVCVCVSNYWQFHVYKISFENSPSLISWMCMKLAEGCVNIHSFLLLTNAHTHTHLILLYTLPVNINGYVPSLINTLNTIVRVGDLCLEGNQTGDKRPGKQSASNFIDGGMGGQPNGGFFLCFCIYFGVFLPFPSHSL